jgi:hypothetical protein
MKPKLLLDTHILAHQVLTLAVTGRDGRPCAAALFYVADENLRLFALTDPATCHGQAMLADDAVALIAHVDFDALVDGLFGCHARLLREFDLLRQRFLFLAQRGDVRRQRGFLDHADTVANITLFAKEVLPRLRELNPEPTKAAVAAE